MRTSIALTLALACPLVAALACNKNEPGTTDPESASDEELLGIDVGSAPREKHGEAVPVGCIQDPSDPDCAEVLGIESVNGEVNFKGDTCRINLCHNHGDCELDADGFVACTCDDNATGETCKNRKK